MPNSTIIRRATTKDLKDIRSIQNHHILHTDDIYSEQLLQPSDVQIWWEEKKASDFPILIAEVSKEFAGFASFGQFRKRTSYSTTVEHSIYLLEKNRGLGLGRTLMEKLFEMAKAQKVHAMIGGIDSKNHQSIAFHQALGFNEVGRIPEVAKKKDKWLELVMMQKILLIK